MFAVRVEALGSLPIADRQSQAWQCAPTIWEEYEAGARELAQWLRVLAALAEDPGLVPSTHMLAHSYPQL